MCLEKPTCKCSTRGRRETLWREQQTRDLGCVWTSQYVKVHREVVGRPYDEHHKLRIWGRLDKPIRKGSSRGRRETLRREPIWPVGDCFAYFCIVNKSLTTEQRVAKILEGMRKAMPENIASGCSIWKRLSASQSWRRENPLRERGTWKWGWCSNTNGNCINTKHGYKRLEICSPENFMKNEYN